MTREEHYETVRQAIRELSEERPQYVIEARQRATQMSKTHKINCPICADDTRLDILHVFPPLKRNLDDPLIDTDWHVRCKVCGHEDWFTMKLEASDPKAKPLKQHFAKQTRRRKRKRRNR